MQREENWGADCPWAGPKRPSPNASASKMPVVTWWSSGIRRLENGNSPCLPVRSNWS